MDAVIRAPAGRVPPSTDLSADNTGSIRDHDAQIENIFTRFDRNTLFQFSTVSLDPQNR
jgi:hypothetical protein